MDNARKSQMGLGYPINMNMKVINDPSPNLPDL